MKTIRNLVLFSFITFVIANVCEYGLDTQVTVTATSNIGQTFVAPLTGNLRQVTLVKSGTFASFAEVELFSGQVLNSGAGVQLANSTLSSSAGFHEAYFGHAPVVAGQTYTLLVTPSDPLTLNQGYYTNGTAILDGSLQSFDLAFAFCFSTYEYESNMWFAGQTVDNYLMEMDSAGKLIVVGTLYGNATLSNKKIILQKMTAFIAKYDSQHNMLWNHMFLNSSSVKFGMNPSGIGIAKDDSIVMVGYSFLPVQFETSNCTATPLSFVVRYSPDGTELWSECWGPSAYPLNDVVVSDDSFIYISGATYGNVSINGTYIGRDSEYVYYVAKLTMSGEFVWITEAPASCLPSRVYGDTITSFSVYNTNTTISGNPLIYDGNYEQYGILFQLSTVDGSEIWRVSMPGSVSAYEMDVDTNGDIVIAASTYGNFSIQNVDIMDSQGPGLLAKFSSAGVLLWAKQVAGGDPTIIDVNIGYQNTIFFNGYGSYDNFSLGDEILPPSSNYIAALTPDGDFLWIDYFVNDYADTYCIATTINSTNLAWSNNIYNENTTLDGEFYSMSSFIHFYNGTYVEGSYQPIAVASASASPSPASDSDSSANVLFASPLLFALLSLLLV